VVFEEVDLHQVEWRPCSKRAKKFVPLTGKTVTVKANWKPSKFADAMDHFVKGYTDDATVISNNIDTHCSVLQEIYLMLKPSKCILFLFDGVKVHLSKGISLCNGTTRLITKGRTKFLGKLVDVCISVSN